MKQKPAQSQYNQTINLTSHLILTQPKAVTALLEHYGVDYTSKPTRKTLINDVVELMKNEEQFNVDLGELLALHAKENNNAIMELEGSQFNYHDEEDDFWGGLIKGAVGLVGGLFKKKKRRRGGGDGGAAARAASAKANAQAATAKRDMELQMQRMREEQRLKEAEERKRREEERRKEEQRRQEEKAKAEKSKTTTMLMAGGGVLMLLVVGMVALKPKSAPAAPYYPPPPRMP